MPRSKGEGREAITVSLGTSHLLTWEVLLGKGLMLCCSLSPRQALDMVFSGGEALVPSGVTCYSFCLTHPIPCNGCCFQNGVPGVQGTGTRSYLASATGTIFKDYFFKLCLEVTEESLMEPTNWCLQSCFPPWFRHQFSESQKQCGPWPASS